MAAAGHQAEAALEQVMKDYKGNYILAVEGNPPLGEDGMFCMPGGKPFVEKLKHAAKDAKADHRLGLVRLVGLRAGRQAQPDQRGADRQGDHRQADHQGAGLPADRRGDDARWSPTSPPSTASPSSTARAGRRCSTASASTTSATAGRTSTPASSSRSGTTRARKAGYCLYKMGCKGPTTYNACSTTRWNEGVVVPDRLGPRLHRLLARTASGTRARSTTG